MEGDMMNEVFAEFWNFEKGDSGDMRLYRYEMRPDELKRCRAIYAKIERLGITIGTPQRGGEWSNCGKWLKLMTDDSGHIMPLGKIDYAECYSECRKWEALAYALWIEGYPCDVMHCIKYWVITPTVNDARTLHDNIAEIINYLWDCPGCV